MNLARLVAEGFRARMNGLSNIIAIDVMPRKTPTFGSLAWQKGWLHADTLINNSLYRG